MDQEHWIGKNLGSRYMIEELLGQGGMSAVYKANDPNLRRVVAVKMIHPHLSSDPGFVSRFEEEASSVAQLRHPNIVQVYDFNHDGPTYYMVMEFVPGETLQERLARLNRADRGLSPEEVIEIGASVCDAADYAHRRGMVHRDIKPANVLLSVYGQAILTDFGIAKITGGQRHTATGAVVGTALYMSPEQIRGEEIDPRSDVYSLGVMLFEMVSGRPPFEADSAMTLMMMHVNDPVPNLNEIVPGVPESVIKVIYRALAKKPSNRYNTAAEMAAALRSISAGQEKVAPIGETFIETPPSSSESAQADTSQPGVLGEATAVEAAAEPPQANLTPKTGPSVAAAPPENTVIEPDISPAHNKPAGTVIEPPSRPAPTGGVTSPPPPRQTGPSEVYASGAHQPAPKVGSDLKRFVMRKPVLLAGITAVLLITCLLSGGTFLAAQSLAGGRNGNNNGAPAAGESPSSPATDLAGVGLSQPTTSPTEMTAGTPTQMAPTPTLTPQPTSTPRPTQTYTPSPTPVPEPYAMITRITLDNGVYVVEYETYGYTEVLPGQHIHFFFNTVKPENAGYPGNGPWILYGGPRPFKGYSVNQRPADATQMCALVANPDHSIQLETGNCMDLP